MTITIRSGTWTPTIQDASLSDAEGQTYGGGTQGNYTQTGEIITIFGYMFVVSLGTLTLTDGARIGGLPFPAIAGTGYKGGITFHHGTSLVLPAGTNISGSILQNNDYIVLNNWDIADGVSSLLLSQFTDGGTVIFSGQYIAA